MSLALRQVSSGFGCQRTFGYWVTDCLVFSFDVIVESLGRRLCCRGYSRCGGLIREECICRCSGRSCDVGRMNRVDVTSKGVSIGEFERDGSDCWLCDVSAACASAWGEPCSRPLSGALWLSRDLDQLRQEGAGG